ncbi:MAG: DTW domain-containing protein, partial [Bdellovibrionia bacterium]
MRQPPSPPRSPQTDPAHLSSLHLKKNIKNSKKPTPEEAAGVCPRCSKLQDLCVCSKIRPLKTQLQVLILQHPQEPDKHLGTARIAHLALPSSTLKVGLCWPNLSQALGKPAQAGRWAVLYLGSGIQGESPSTDRLQFVSKKGLPLDPPEELEGLVRLAQGDRDAEGGDEAVDAALLHELECSRVVADRLARRLGRADAGRAEHQVE